MSWEWRYFVQTALPADGSLPLQGQREDVYFPASEAAGIKLRNGQGHLEVKLRTRVSDAGVSLPGRAEYWVKDLHDGCLVREKGEVHVDAAACARSVGKPVQELFSSGSGSVLPVQVLCRKKRRHSRYGEEVDCVFIAIIDGQAGRPALVERYQSVSVEGGCLESIAKVVNGMGPLPSCARVGGYPAIVQDIAQRALSQTTPAPDAPALVDEAHEPALPSLPAAKASAGYSAVVEDVMMGASETAVPKLGLQNASGSVITR